MNLNASRPCCGFLTVHLVRLDVKVTVKARQVTVKGPKGEISKSFAHKACEIKVINYQTKKLSGLYVRLRMWNSSYKQAAAVTTFTSLIRNMFIGVTEVSNLPQKLLLSSNSNHSSHATFWCVQP